MKMKTMEHGTPTKEYRYAVRNNYSKIAYDISIIYYNQATLQSTDYTKIFSDSRDILCMDKIFNGTEEVTLAEIKEKDKLMGIYFFVRTRLSFSYTLNTIHTC